MKGVEPSTPSNIREKLARFTRTHSVTQSTTNWAGMQPLRSHTHARARARAHTHTHTHTHNAHTHRHTHTHTHKKRKKKKKKMI